MSSESGERQDSIELSTQTFEYAQFEGILDLTGTLHDHLFDLLRVDFSVNVRNPTTNELVDQITLGQQTSAYSYRAFEPL